MLKPLALVVALLVARVACGAGTADARFSQAISPDERQAIGLAKLTSDELAILDALIRRDIADRMFHEAEPNTPATFTERLTADEQKNTGVAKMSPEERTQLNTTIAKIQIGGQVQTLMTNPVLLPRTASLIRENGKKEKRGLETHGSVSLSYGWGSGGYSTRSGSMVVNMTDPDKKYSITIGYEETHIKGPAGRPAVLLDGPPYYDNELLRP
jgi:hypothetical protein